MTQNSYFVAFYSFAGEDPRLLPFYVMEFYRDRPFGQR